jgi:hypothetical protein
MNATVEQSLMSKIRTMTPQQVAEAEDFVEFLATQASKAYRQIQDMRTRKREMLGRNASRESIRLIEQQITNRMKQFNDQVSRIES